MFPSLPSFPRIPALRRSLMTTMSKRERFLIGGAGGLAPILMFFVNGSVPRYFNSAFAFEALGFLARAVFLFVIGGFVVLLYPEVKQRIKVFQLGLSAPAMIA